MEVKDIKKTFVHKELKLGKLIIREVSNDDLRLQFRVKNKLLTSSLSDVDCEISYYDNRGDFMGCDTETSYHSLAAGKSQSIDLMLSPPEGFSYAELDVRANIRSDKPEWFTSYTEMLSFYLLLVILAILSTDVFSLKIPFISGLLK